MFPLLILFFILIIRLLDIVFILHGEILFWSLMEVKGLKRSRIQCSEVSRSDIVDPSPVRLTFMGKEKAPKRVRTGRIFKFLCLLYSLGAVNE